MMGALIITVVLMGSIFLGFMSSVEKVDVNRTEYEYVTDGTSLFSYTSAPEYVEYSPNANYTHYTTDLSGATVSGPNFYTSGGEYSKSSTVNQYRVFESTKSETQTCDFSGSYTPATLPSTTSWIFNQPVQNIFYYQNEPSYYTLNGYLRDYNCVSLAEYLKTVTLSSINHDHVINLDNSGQVWVLFGTLTSTQAYMNRTGSTDGTYYGNLGIFTDYLLHGEGSLGVGAYSHAIYNDTSSTVTLYDVAGVSVWSGSAADMYLVYGGAYYYVSQESYNASSSAQYWPRTYVYSPPATSFSITTSQVQPATYMNVSEGVQLNATPVYWSNTYDLGKITMLLQAPDSVSTLQIKTMSTSGTVGSDATTVTYNPSIGYLLGNQILGKWAAAELTIDYITKTVTLTGVESVTTMVDYTPSTYSVSTSLTDSPPRILMLDGKQWTLSVNSTTVYMDTYSTVMQDPTLNLADYFANEKFLRLTFESVAYYGDSITVAGTTFPVSDGKISVADGSRTRSYDLTNTEISWENGHVTLSFRNSKTTVDLGDTDDKAVSLAGDWYFDAAIYTGHEVTGQEWQWNAGDWDFTQDAFLLIFLGLLLLAALVIKATKGLGLLDIVILLCAGLVGFVLLG